MIPETPSVQELFTSIDQVTSEFVQAASALPEEQLNRVPFKDSWTAAQVADHVFKSVTSVLQALHAPGKPASRNPDERVQYIKDTFLDFTTKLKSPAFIVPTEQTYEKPTLITHLQTAFNGVTATGKTVNLTEILQLPVLGEMTKLELLYFVLYHTQRHLHQLNNISQAIQQ